MTPYDPPRGGGPTPAVPAWPATPPPAGVAAPLAKRLDTFALVVLITAGFGVAWVLFRLASQIVAGPLLHLYLAWLSNISPHARIDEMMGPAQVLQERVLPFEIGRSLLFGAAVGALAWIALRLRKKQPAALAALRTWCLAAFGVLAVTTVIEVAFVLPATLEYTAGVTRAMKVPAALPIDVGKLTSQFTIASTIFSIAFGALILAAIPAVLLGWGSRLRRELEG